MQHELDKFLCVVEAQSFSGAAKKLHISQPALSMAIKNLEKSLGTELLLRQGRGFVVTEAGQVVLGHAKKIRLSMDNLKSELADELQSVRTLKVGMIDSIGDLLFADENEIDETNLQVTVANSKTLIDMLARDQLDIVLITKPDVIRGNFTVEEMGLEKFKLVSAPEMAREVADNIKVNRLIPKMLTYDQKSTTFAKITRQIGAAKLKFQPIFYSTSPDLIRSMAIRGRGAALLPASKIADDLTNGTLVEIKDVEFSRGIMAVTLRGKFVSKAMKSIVESVKKGLK